MPHLLPPEIPSEGGVALRFPLHSKAHSAPAYVSLILKDGFEAGDRKIKKPAGL